MGAHIIIALCSGGFFQKFPKAEEIEVELITASGQKAIEWEKETKKIKLPTLSK